MLAGIMEKVRHELLINDESILIGNLSNGIENGIDMLVKSYSSFLNIRIGVRYGTIDFRSYNTFLRE